MSADYIATTVTADQAVQLTLELSRHENYGGFAYRPPPCQAGVHVDDALLWLNGEQLPLHNKLAAYTRVSVARRRGWHDAVLVDVNVQPGTSLILLSLRKRNLRAWFTAVSFTPNPVPALWALLEHDFPRCKQSLARHDPLQLVRSRRRLVFR